MRTLPVYSAWRYDLIRIHMAKVGNLIGMHHMLNAYSELDSLIVLDS